MAYPRPAQIRDAVEVLCERINLEMYDRRQSREWRQWLVENYKRQKAWRKALVQQSLHTIENESETAIQSDRLRISSTRKTIEQIRAAVRKANNSVAKLPGFVAPSFDDLKEMEHVAEAWLRPPLPRDRTVGHRQALAVREAAFLIDVTNEVLPRTIARRKPDKGLVGSQWYRLSAILLGAPNADLFNIMRKYKKLELENGART